jgi:ribosome-associated toxin RatA of RatAB toxin-antitoxin module
MTQIHRHALVMHSAARMFELVNDVPAYPRRFNWCEDSAVLEASEGLMVARLHLKLGALRTQFTTRNTLEAPTRIRLSLVDGPFRRLEGAWTFHALDEEACKVSLQLDFDVAGPFIGGALALGFQGLADRLVDDFVAVARREGG